MEQSETSRTSLLASATADEIIISQILLDLRCMMSLSESLSNFNWGCRRRRSCLDAPPPPPPPPLTKPSYSPENRIEERRTLIKTEVAAAQDEKQGGGARTTGSPDTPLSFSPSESDERPKYSSKKSSKKRSRKEYMEKIEGLTQCKESLAGEIENVKKYYNKLKAFNSQLKAIKQQVLNSGLSLRREETGMERIGNLGVELTRHYRIDSEADPTAQNCRYFSGPIAAHLQPSDDGIRPGSNGGPLGFDLNLPAEEACGVDAYRPLDVGRAIADKRARFAEARRKRIGIIKTKSNRSAL